MRVCRLFGVIYNFDDDHLTPKKIYKSDEMMVKEIIWSEIIIKIA